MNLPSTHHVVYHCEKGTSSVIQEAHLPLPHRPPGHLLIQVEACSINPKDWKGRLAAGSRNVKSCLGEDIAGRVVSSDPSSLFQPGDRIFSMLPMLQWRGNTRFFKTDASYLFKSQSRTPETTSSHGQIRWGASCEYTVVEERFVSKLPDSISFIDGASVCLASLTALQNLKKAGLNVNDKTSLKGKHVLIHAGAGGVGR